MSRAPCAAAVRIEGVILTPRGWVLGALAAGADGRIAAVDGTHIDELRVRDAGLPVVVDRDLQVREVLAEGRPAGHVRA